MKPRFCPECGREEIPRTDDDFTKCNGCGAVLYLDGKIPFKAWMMEPLFGKDHLTKEFSRLFPPSNALPEIHIRSIQPRLLPFWKTGNSRRLHSASTDFPQDEIPLPPLSPTPFHCSQDQFLTMPDRPEPKEDQPAELYFLPFYDLHLHIHEQSQQFWYNRMTGQTAGPPIFYMSPGKMQKSFFFFSFMFLIQIVIYLTAPSVWDAFLVNAALTALFYFYSISSASFPSVRNTR